LNVFVSTVTGIASTEMKGYIQCSKKVSEYALRKWFPENEGTCLFVVSGGLCGDSSYESDMKLKSPWMISKLIGDLRLNNSGKRQVIQRLSYRVRRFFGVWFSNISYLLDQKNNSSIDGPAIPSACHTPGSSGTTTSSLSGASSFSSTMAQGRPHTREPAGSRCARLILLPTQFQWR